MFLTALLLKGLHRFIMHRESAKLCKVTPRRNRRREKLFLLLKGYETLMKVWNQFSPSCPANTGSLRNKYINFFVCCYPFNYECYIHVVYSDKQKSEICARISFSLLLLFLGLTNTGANQCKTPYWIRKAWQGQININTTLWWEQINIMLPSVWVFRFLVFLQFAYTAIWISAG